MKKQLWMVTVLALMLHLTVMAQNEMPPRDGKGPGKEMRHRPLPEMNPEKRAERLAKEFKLSDNQKAQLKSLFEKQKVKMEDHRAEMKKKMETERAVMDKERKAMDEELQKIVGKENFEKMKLKRDKMKDKIHQRPHRGKGWQGRPDRTPNDSVPACHKK